MVSDSPPRSSVEQRDAVLSQDVLDDMSLSNMSARFAPEIGEPILNEEERVGGDSSISLKVSLSPARAYWLSLPCQL